MRRVDSSGSLSSVGSAVFVELWNVPLPREDESTEVFFGDETSTCLPSDEEGLDAWAEAQLAKKEKRKHPIIHGEYVGLGKAREVLRVARLAKKREAADALGGPTKKRSDPGQSPYGVCAAPVNEWWAQTSK